MLDTVDLESFYRSRDPLLHVWGILCNLSTNIFKWLFTKYFKTFFFFIKVLWCNIQIWCFSVRWKGCLLFKIYSEQFSLSLNHGERYLRSVLHNYFVRKTHESFFKSCSLLFSSKVEHSQIHSHQTLFPMKICCSLKYT